MSAQDNTEFKQAVKDIAAHSAFLQNPYDRVRCAEWTRKLASLRDDDLEHTKLRNQYAQYLRIQVRNNFLHAPFLEPPPDKDPCSLGEHLANMN